MKITAITPIIARFGNRPRVLVKVETDEGITGWGETYSIGPDLAVGPTVDYCFELIKGIDPRRIEFIMMKLHQQFRFPPGGIGLSAISGIDHALWDISGKAAGVPVYQLLGGHARDRVRVYRGIGGRDGKEAADQARRLHEEYGFTAFKTSPYQLDPDAHRWGRVCSEATKYFEELRVNCPDDWEFAFDPHAKIFEPVRALQLANALAPYDPFFYEEPMRPEHIPAWTSLKSQMQVPLATGESLYARFEFLDLIANQGADIIQPDICVCGGLLEMRKINAIAEAHYISIAPHNPMGPLATAVNLHFCASAPNFKILEYLLPTESEWNDWVDEPYLPKERLSRIATGPAGARRRGQRRSHRRQRIHPLGTLQPDPSRRLDRVHLMLSRDHTALVLIDIQGKLASLMHEREALYRQLQILVEGAQVLKLPILWLEQYPKGLGPTIPEVAALLSDQEPLAKTCFSACGLSAFQTQLRQSGRRQILLAGIESHICVYQTARDLLDSGYQVEVVTDAVSSRTAENKELGLQRMASAGAQITAVEMCLFELLQEAGTAEFKQIAALVK